MLFPTPAPLIATAQILYAVAAESQDYRLDKVTISISHTCYRQSELTCFQENCWFFASVIQEILVRNFGAQYQSGDLNHPTLANQRRALIVTHAYRELSREVDSGTDAVLKLTELISDSDLASVVKSCIDTLKEQHVRKLSSIKSLVRIL
jgi:hypothetical protein